jgi:Zn-dependent protease with chaperone function
MNNFFEQQDHARRESRKLLILFGLAVTAIVVVVNITLAVAWQYAMRGHGPVRYPQGFFVITTLGVLLFIGLGTLYQIFQLRDGGDAVAEMAGGRLVSPDSTDLHERRLLNVVEEMALASGIACPNVYILDEEDGINAFAAGFQQNQAVVAVTRGTLERLNRDELQGVVGHEFSHILNGDMRMNIQLIGVLFGIQMLALFGRELFEWGARFSGGSRSKDDKGPSLGMIMLVVGIVLFVVGYVGIFFGRLIQSAISRQREFLADASAVQFTRNRRASVVLYKKSVASVSKPVAALRYKAAKQSSYRICFWARHDHLFCLVCLPPIRRWKNGCVVYTAKMCSLYKRMYWMMTSSEMKAIPSLH